MNSPAMKAFGDERIAAGERCLVVDLGACTSMDSTFMGTLAGMAARLSGQDGALQIAGADARNRRSLEDLGLDFLMEIDPPDAHWHNKLTTIREGLVPSQKSTPASSLQRTMHVLEAHQVLAGTSDKNAQTFSNVVTLLGDELAEKQKLAESQKPR
jgi:anti-sigma B factor antagonist